MLCVVLFFFHQRCWGKKLTGEKKSNKTNNTVSAGGVGASVSNGQSHQLSSSLKAPESFLMDQPEDLDQVLL